MPGTNGKRNRLAGHNLERSLVKDFALFYPNISTSRATNRARDDEKVDLAYSDELKYGRFPYNVQAKNYSRPIRYPKILSELPIVDNVINVIIHKQTQKVGTRFMPVGTYAILPYDDFMKMVAWRKGYKILKEYADGNSSIFQAQDLSDQLKQIGL